MPRGPIELIDPDDMNISDPSKVRIAWQDGEIVLLVPVRPKRGEN